VRRTSSRILFAHAIRSSSPAAAMSDWFESGFSEGGMQDDVDDSFFQFLDFTLMQLLCILNARLRGVPGLERACTDAATALGIRVKSGAPTTSPVRRFVALRCASLGSSSCSVRSG
jgi:hypothetical protein